MKVVVYYILILLLALSVCFNLYLKDQVNQAQIKIKEVKIESINYNINMNNKINEINTLKEELNSCKYDLEMLSL